MTKYKLFTVGVAALFIFALAASFTSSALWYDEAYSLSLARLPLLEMVRLESMDFNPPLWDIILWPVIHIVGVSAQALRFLPFVFMGLSLILVGYLAFSGLPSNAGATWAVLVAALLPISFWSGSDGRVYALFTLLYLLGFYFILKNRLVGFAAVCGLLCWAHNTGVFYAISLILTGIAFNRGDTIKHLVRRRCIQIVAAGALGCLTFVPWLASYLHSTGQDFWLGPLSFSGFSYALTQSVFAGAFSAWPVIDFAAGCLVMFTFFAALILSVGPLIVRFTSKSAFRIGQMAADYYHIPVIRSSAPKISTRFMDLVFTVYALAPIGLMLIVSLTWKNIIFYRPLVPAVLPLVLWAVNTLKPNRLTLTTAVLPGLWAVLIVSGSIVFDPSSKGGDLRNAADLINNSGTTAVYHATGTSWLPASYYINQDIDQYILYDDQSDGLLQPMLGAVFGAKYSRINTKNYWLVWARDPELTDQAEKELFTLVGDKKPVAVVASWQFSPIEIYRIGEGY